MMTLPLSRFKRELNSLTKRINSNTDPLDRVLITQNGEVRFIATRIEEDDELGVIVESRKNQSEVKVNIDDL